MKKTTLLLLLISFVAFSQQPYYNDVDITLTGQDLYFELQSKIDNASSSFNYGDVRDTMKITDEDPNNTNNVLLIYGYDDTGSCTTDRSRDKDDFGGTSCEYNREHVFARSNANPTMGSVNNGSTGIAADPHNLRPSDQQMNNNKGNKSFAAGSGTAGDVGSGNWYPGDEWKGDVARMLMYMYTRYGDRCLPSLNAVGATQGSTDMLQILLQWNAEDQVNDYEDQRNPYLETAYGNRNPFIDNPYLATIIWGGPIAEDRWGIAGVAENELASVSIYPNPTSEKVWIETTSEFIPETYSIYDISGRLIIEDNITTSEAIDVSNLNSGIYVIEVANSEKKGTQKLIVQ
ncbi:endonuclease [Ulvibacter litoralis]|uniref:Por secretion system C-terminal sorting domain-containing protein n=1 Tax=Ulvibacter litoralis TaxID=227084 RepID=A0A1G7F1Z6_9FLAO|nr:endonuclease [Ulvibacter litoralis]GHC52998.1 hypothetical protein GCM10008083_16200 [Ulvibacter litoralis]SDE69901.1 Por secretion system C-terminal sorting domain-containing protein [Ulvibacter litoralis]